MSDIEKQNNDKGIEITEPAYDKRAVVPNEGIQIFREGKPISGDTTERGIVYLLIDCSSSMAEGDKLDQVKKGAINFAKEARVKEYIIGLIQFADTAIHLCEPQQEISTLFQYLEIMQAEGCTNMTEALHLVFEKLKSRAGNRVVVLVTDGEPTTGEPSPEEATLQAAHKLKENGIDIITIGTDDADREFLGKIATRTDLTVMVQSKGLEKGIALTAKKLPMLQSGK